MSVLASGTTKTLEIQDVKIVIKKLSYGEQKEAMKISKKDEMAMLDLTILKSVKEWDIKNEAGEVLPVEESTLNLLESGFVNELAQEILRYNNMDPDFEKNLDEPSKQV